MTLRAISLFSNCGAGDVGYARAGIKFDVMAELEADRLSLALLNHKGATGIAGDLRETLPDVVRTWRAKWGRRHPDLLAACPPCQGMSTARSGRGHEHDADAGSRDSRNLLVEVVAEAASKLSPRVIVVENVRAFLTRKVRHPVTQDPVSAAVLLYQRLSRDYILYPASIQLADYGVPQLRQRVFLTFIRRNEIAVRSLVASGATPYPRPTHADSHVSVRAALVKMGLPMLDASQPSTAVDPGRELHNVPHWTPDRYEMVAAIPPYSGKTAWQNDKCSSCNAHIEDSEAAICPGCKSLLPRPVIVDTGGPRLISGFRRSSYSRMHPDRPAATITTASGRVSSSNTIHPWENRVLSPLECAGLQTFPEDFKWGQSRLTRGDGFIREVIGEAVPPLFTEAHGRVLVSLLRGRRPRKVLDSRARQIAGAMTTLRAAGLEVELSAHSTS